MIDLRLDHILMLVTIVITVSGGVFSTITAVIAYFIRRNEAMQDRSIRDLQQAHESLSVAMQESISWIKSEMVAYKAQAGVSATAVAAVHTDLKDHVTKEESIFWKKIDAITQAHQALSNALLQRLTVVESKLPNGELERMAVDIATLVAQMSATKEKAQQAIEHVKEHDEEAGQWKRMIERNDERLKILEERVGELVRKRVRA